MDSFSKPTLPTPVNQEKEQKNTSLVPDLIRGVISLKSLPMPDQLARQTPANQLAIIVDDGTEVTLKLAGKLMSNGNKVVVLTLPEELVSKRSNLPETLERVGIS